MIVILFSFLVAYYAAKPVSTSCPLEMSPASVVVPFGSSVSAVCKSLSNQTKGMGWESPYGGTGLVKGVSNLTLQIDSLQHWRVRPICYANVNGSQCTKVLPVTVYKMADNVTISLENHVGLFREWEIFIMVCEVNQVAPIRNASLELLHRNERLDKVWFDDFGVDMPVSRSLRHAMLAKREYNGEHFRCVARMDFGPLGPNLPEISSEPLELNVHYAPTFNQPKNETVTLPVGGRMSLNCSASGNPAPEYSWKVPSASKVPNGTQAIFVDSSFKHPGTYECAAVNSEGTVTKHFTVTQAARTQTTLAAVLGVFVALAVVLGILGLFFLTPQGTFSCNKGSYLPGRATSGPV
ncbi:intercellular adhesion molecule 1-like [Festucalex cinctus]